MNTNRNIELKNLNQKIQGVQTRGKTVVPYIKVQVKELDYMGYAIDCLLRVYLNSCVLILFVMVNYIHVIGL